MNASATVEQSSKLLREHGLATVLVVVLLGVLGYLAYMQQGQLTGQIEDWQAASERSLGALRDDLQKEREFIRGGLTKTLDDNSEATRAHTEAIRELTNEIKHGRKE